MGATLGDLEQDGVMEYEEIRDLWEEFARTPFPAEGEFEFGDIDLHLVDTFAAGCISTFVGARRLDQDRRNILRTCRDDLEQVLPQLSGDAKTYFEALTRLSNAVLQILTEKSRGRY